MAKDKEEIDREALHGRAWQQAAVLLSAMPRQALVSPLKLQEPCECRLSLEQIAEACKDYIGTKIHSPG